MSINQTFDAMRAAMEAYDRLPEAEREIEKLKRELEHREHEINVKIEAYTSLSDRNHDLSTKLRSVEAERDQYGFRNLELDERLAKIAAILPALAGAVEREPEVKQPVGESHGTDAAPSHPENVEPVNTGSYPLVHVEPAEPTSLSPRLDEPEQEEPINKPDSFPVVHFVEVDRVNPVPTTRPYAGQGHFAKPIHLTWGEWIDGGGNAPWTYDRLAR